MEVITLEDRFVELESSVLLSLRLRNYVTDTTAFPAHGRSSARLLEAQCLSAPSLTRRATRKPSAEQGMRAGPMYKRS